MTSGDHLTNELLVRAIDDELPESETVLVTAHLSHCQACKQKHQELTLVSSRLETLLRSLAIDASYSERDSFKRRLEPHQQTAIAAHGAEKVMRRFGWGMAIAATL